MLVTMGDPAGIGPEIIAKALCERPELQRQLVVVGDMATLERAALATDANDGRATLGFVQISDLSHWGERTGGRVSVIQACKLKQPVAWGRIDALAGRAAADCIRFAAEAALKGEARAVVTAPIHKEALAAAGVSHPGHTEFLQALAAAHQGVSVDALPVRMMLSCPGLSTVLVSIHVSLRQALEAVTVERILQTLRITHAHFRLCGLPLARIAVAGLNPHAG
ncbi:MAG: 4-hydroxythreonine-4-phosphate dehydrogenase PdxA, partial [Hydrogenophaga sp.]|nr:4-hydroxythreonine-4-phosphate dehydrogenase PdxA [Hydrogenophaga sp.]